MIPPNGTHRIKGCKYESPVVIIGAGISGLCIAVDLIRQNKSRDFIILERNAEVGGTWADNRYPGCRCDVSSHLYSFSFEPNPNWSGKYSKQPEILSYVTGVAEKWSLYPNIRFNTEVEECRWGEDDRQWKIKVTNLSNEEEDKEATYEIRANFLVSAVGQLNIPNYPEIDGLSSFKGKIIHSARWDATYPMEKKHIGIIGNGASAVQIIPELADICQSMTIYQRTPNWVIPRMNFSYPSIVKRLFRWLPGFRSSYRQYLCDLRELGFEALVMPDSDLNKFLKAQSIGMMKSQLKKKPHLREKITPTYPPGCKRIIPHDEYYLALDNSHVDLETTPIQRISSEGIITIDGKETKLDVLILATGFRTVEFMHPIRVYGVKGRDINDIWEGGARAYLGITVESLPNFAMAYGPNTNLGHSSIIMMVEAQSRYINTLIRAVLRANRFGNRNTDAGKERLVIVPKAEKVEEYNKRLQERLEKTTFGSTQCKSWYKNADGVVTNNWCGTVVEYQKLTSKLQWDDYEVSGTASGELAPPGKTVKLGRVYEESILTRLGLFKPLMMVATLGGFLTGKMSKIFGY